MKATDAFYYWVSGLIDGEGCFRIHRQKVGEYYAPSFSLKLRDDDAPILEEVVTQLGFGRLSYDTTRTGNSRPCVCWHCDSRDATELLLTLLDRYPLRTRKARDYEIWRRAVIARRSMPRGNRWHGPRDWTPLIDLKRELEEARAYVERG